MWMLLLIKKAMKQGQIIFYLYSNNFLYVPLQGLVHLLQRKPSPMGVGDHISKSPPHHWTLLCLWHDVTTTMCPRPYHHWMPPLWPNNNMKPMLPCSMSYNNNNNMPQAVLLPQWANNNMPQVMPPPLPRWQNCCTRWCHSDWEPWG